MKTKSPKTTFKPEWIVIHHSATGKDCTVEEIRKMHLERGWDDIGYHWLIDCQGNVYRGRKEDVIGAHAKGLNDRSIGICCIGNFEEEALAEETLKALKELIARVRKRYGIKSTQIIGHRDVKELSQNATDTLCPGRNLYSLLKTLRRRPQAKRAGRKTSSRR